MAVPPPPSDLGQDQHDHEEEVAENTDQEELDRGVNRHGVGSRASGGSPGSMEARGGPAARPRPPGVAGRGEPQPTPVNAEPPREVARPAFGANPLPDHLDRPIGGLL